VIILQFDNSYFHWGLLALQSLHLHEPQTRVLCNTVNLTDRQTTELETAHANLEITNGISDRQTAPEQMAARKPFVIQHAMQNDPAEPWYALLDADLLIRKPLGPLWSLLDDRPAALCITDGMENGRFYRYLLVPSGLVLVRREATQLIESWARWCKHQQPLYNIEPMAWYWDQLTLAEAWSEAGVLCAVIPMHIYSDDQLRPDAAIWSANVHEKTEYYAIFRKEYQRQALLIACGDNNAPAVTEKD
jgi:hypothetical protein